MRKLLFIYFIFSITNQVVIGSSSQLITGAFSFFSQVSMPSNRTLILSGITNDVVIQQCDYPGDLFGAPDSYSVGYNSWASSILSGNATDFQIFGEAEAIPADIGITPPSIEVTIALRAVTTLGDEMAGMLAYFLDIPQLIPMGSDPDMKTYVLSAIMLAMNNAAQLMIYQKCQGDQGYGIKDVTCSTVFSPSVAKVVYSNGAGQSTSYYTINTGSFAGEASVFPNAQ